MSPLGDTPYIFKGGQEDLKRLFFSDPSRAFAKPITIPPGYGIIKAGTVMGRIDDGPRQGQHVPFVPADTTGDIVKAMVADEARGLVYIVDDIASGTTVHVTMEDSYKFLAEDEVATIDSGGTDDDGGAIQSIVRTTYSHIAVITVENEMSAITVANGGCIFLQTAESAPYSQARGILKATVDTGVGENSKGAQGVLVIGNAMLYLNNLYCYSAGDDDILDDITGWREDAPYLII